MTIRARTVIGRVLRIGNGNAHGRPGAQRKRPAAHAQPAATCPAGTRPDRRRSTHRHGRGNRTRQGARLPLGKQTLQRRQHRRDPTAEQQAKQQPQPTAGHQPGQGAFQSGKGVWGRRVHALNFIPTDKSRQAFLWPESGLFSMSGDRTAAQGTCQICGGDRKDSHLRSDIPQSLTNIPHNPTRAPPAVPLPRNLHDSPAIPPRLCAGDRRLCAQLPAPTQFIPAWAANASAAPSCRPTATVHPRVDGERQHTPSGNAATFGSSPRGRGTQGAVGVRAQHQRFIPAWAGNAGAGTGRSAPPSVHPRVGGERLFPALLL